ncbi:MAG: hypothetical protein CMJ25_07485 [Phycisphaerae bacterium]|nr:hypothetical protein [Phycisphaerae bacterium]
MMKQDMETMFLYLIHKQKRKEKRKLKKPILVMVKWFGQMDKFLWLKKKKWSNQPLKTMIYLFNIILLLER